MLFTLQLLFEDLQTLGLVKHALRALEAPGAIRKGSDQAHVTFVDPERKRPRDAGAYLGFHKDLRALVRVGSFHGLLWPL